MIQLDKKCSDVESFLTFMGSFPVIGTVAGAVKITLGLIQTISGLAAGVFLSIYVASQKNKDWSLAVHAWTHVKHGLGNIMAGTLEAIPFVGLLMNGIRIYRANLIYKQVVYIRTNQDHKFMPYLSMEAESFQIEGSKDSAINEVKASLNDINSLSSEQKLKLNREALKNYYDRVLKK